MDPWRFLYCRLSIRSRSQRVRFSCGITINRGRTPVSAWCREFEIVALYCMNGLLTHNKLGFLPPSSLNANSNLGAKDVVNALSFVKKVSNSFGGNQQVTLAGQSSGATLIRGLLAAPSAQSLFQKAWLHSDPIVRRFLSIEDTIDHRVRRTDSIFLLPRRTCRTSSIRVSLVELLISDARRQHP